MCLQPHRSSPYPSAGASKSILSVISCTFSNSSRQAWCPNTKRCPSKSLRSFSISPAKLLVRRRKNLANRRQGQPPCLMASEHASVDTFCDPLRLLQMLHHPKDTLRTHARLEACSQELQSGVFGFASGWDVGVSTNPERMSHDQNRVAPAKKP